MAAILLGEDLLLMSIWVKTKILKFNKQVGSICTNSLSSPTVEDLKRFIFCCCDAVLSLVIEGQRGEGACRFIMRLEDFGRSPGAL